MSERVMVLEGLRGLAVGDSPARGQQYVRAVGAGGAGGKGLARVEDCLTCLDVGEYEALARERSRLALRASTMRASTMRRDAQGAIDLVVAEGAAKALAANASAKAKIAGLRGLSDAQRRGYIDQLSASSARIMGSSSGDWIGRGSGGYARIAGLGADLFTVEMAPQVGTVATGGGGAWVAGPDGQYYWDTSAAGPEWSTGTASTSNLPPGVLPGDTVDLEAERARAAEIASVKPGGVRSVTLTNYALSAPDRSAWEGQIGGWRVGPWYTGGSPPYISQAAQVKNGTLPFKVNATQEFRYNGPARTLTVSVNEKSWIASVVEDLSDAAREIACIAARKAADMAYRALPIQCGETTATADCILARQARDEGLRKIGCGPKTAAPPVVGSKKDPPVTESNAGAIAAVGAGALLLMLLAG